MNIRVLHTPTAVGGHPSGLAAAERKLGLDSTVVTLDEPPYGYAVDRVLAPAGTRTAVRELRRWRTVLEARGFDVVHFNFGSSLAPGYYGSAGRGGPYRLYARLFEQRDLWLLRGRPVFVTFQGDDVRPSGDAEQDALKRRRAERFARAADGLYVLNPDLLEHVPRAEFLPYASVDPREWAPAPPTDRGTLRVVHAPSDRDRKGTGAVVSAVEQLRSEGVDDELELVEGRPRAEARRAYERADVLVDQLVVGWYGGVAVEAMALAKPVVARLDEAALARVPSPMRDELPIVDAVAATLADVLRRLATERRSGLAELGRRGRKFAERWHDPVTIAERVVADYERALARR
ncbi:MAG: glycosyltransferase family 1 protein [Actinomycetota bacterium]